MFRNCLLALSLFVCAAPFAWGMESFAPIVRSERTKVVHISTSSVTPPGPKGSQRDPLMDRFLGPRPKKSSALGSGFVFSEDGYIVTNNHVVERADKIEVTFYDGKTYEAKVVGTDAITDLALIKVEAKGLKPVLLGDSEKLEVGDWVLAIGNPLGLDYTVTAGIISAKGRDIFGGTAYGQFLQTDAAINPGNSGGPLFDVQGKVVGINTAIAQGQGLGFAIPINLAKTIFDQLKTSGKVERGWLGIGIQEMNEDLALSFGLDKDSKGIVVTSIGPDSPAEKGGLKQGDVITEIEGRGVDKTTQLQQTVAEAKPGSVVKLKVFRANKSLALSVTLGKRPESEIATNEEEPNPLGFQLAEIDPTLRQEWGIKEKIGLLVVEVDPDSLAYEKGIRRGDILVEVDGLRLNKLADFEKAQQKSRGRMRLLLKRDGESIYLALPLGP
ncbi:MAG: hypothetical protein A2600_09360 [Candidatus Lambdaproteobacteria bacterium RIFOXYD1_FULL_56_27]|uniref:PDZ domain-containing protein n=1 Tax=Candidatus Lambdaproteobacteria bacterium RIFOXYD2_FULL_56_26 TaxID=1817773 RepID=A0A1F6GV27_9PROT|nr:MAG: hypothetical protein A2557_04630 [Candidatus Lambdaproteobacteria bacterium RIFOXYD2_FULL_56_26]OGH02260.1 MAG: hypothetical protein A2426_03110 [Candidatus Lambdaproteobacteria bacterium RIFOXYC1_FULL_56_13]OGH10029.1 MAG: hypothetical protein A2600_09360 [Candidatus Lambdaproteobacteria bacterium RIFOXYD1_FULL_56_27]